MASVIRAEAHGRGKGTALKRLFDIVISAAALTLFAPVLLGLAIAVWVSLGRPILFRQERPGRGGAPFTLYKFRTMRNDRGADGRLLPDERRLGRFGRWLRASSLDELPEFWNVLKGEMSLVGPRPLLLEYLPLYTPEQARRHLVRPGLTGWAQVRGRNALSWDERLALDIWYVEHQSLLLDLEILLRTALVAFTARGVRHGQHATMPKFTGSAPGRHE